MLPFKQSLLLLVVLSTCHGSPPNTTEYCVPECLPVPPGETPSCAKNGETYCEKIDTYPKDHIQQLIDKKKYNYNTFFFDEDEEQFCPRYQGSPKFPLCPAINQNITPQAAVNSQGIWMYIVNQGANSNSMQYVTVNKCQFPDTQCDMDMCTLRNDYNSTCEQQHIKINLLALSKDGKKLYPHKFTLPHCCLCMIIDLKSKNNQANNV